MGAVQRHRSISFERGNCNPTTLVNGIRRGGLRRGGQPFAAASAICMRDFMLDQPPGIGDFGRDLSGVGTLETSYSLFRD